MGESAGRDCRPALASTHTHTYLGVRVCTCAGPVHTSGAMWHVCESVLNLCVAHMHQTRVCVHLGRGRIILFALFIHSVSTEHVRKNNSFARGYV